MTLGEILRATQEYLVLAIFLKYSIQELHFFNLCCGISSNILYSVDSKLFKQ